MSKTKVSITRVPPKASEHQIEASVRQAIDLAGGLEDLVKKGDTVLIKPNICIPMPQEKAANTHPEIAKAIANIIRELGARAVIGESSGVADDTEVSIEAAGYNRLREEGYEVIDLKSQKTTKVSVPKGKSYREIDLPAIVMEAALIISVPVMKTHVGETVTLSMKNMKGILPDKYKKLFHTTYGVTQGVVDLLTVAKPGFAIVDGILAQEGFGPLLGNPVEMNLLIAGKDAVAVDAVTANLMGFKTSEIPIVSAAEEVGIGKCKPDEIEITGTPLSEVQRRFKRPEEAFHETIPYPTGLEVIIDERACTGCRQCLFMALHDMHEASKLDKAEGMTIVAGKTDTVPDVDRSKLLLVGLCTRDYRDKGQYLKGCPVQPWDIIAAITGEKQSFSWQE